MDFEKVVLEKLDKIELKQIEHTVELARYNIILNEHHVRASNQESRIKPMEAHILLSNGIFKVIMGLAALGASMVTIYHYVLSK